jgi:hypothetical protein
MVSLYDCIVEWFDSNPRAMYDFEIRRFNRHRFDIIHYRTQTPSVRLIAAPHSKKKAGGGTIHAWTVNPNGSHGELIATMYAWDDNLTIEWGLTILSIEELDENDDEIHLETVLSATDPQFFDQFKKRLARIASSGYDFVENYAVDSA